MAKATEHQEKLDELEDAVEELRRRYDLYFLGSDAQRTAPNMRRDNLKAEMARLRGDSQQWSTRDRFRLGSIMQKFTTLNHMWVIRCRAVEEGRSPRDRFRLKRIKQEETAQTLAPPESPRNGAEKSRPAAADAEAFDDEKYRRLYSVYVQAKKRTGEDTSLSYESLRAQIQKQIPALKQKHNCKEVEFKVVLKNGKAMLKAVPK